MCTICLTERTTAFSSVSTGLSVTSWFDQKAPCFYHSINTFKSLIFAKTILISHAPQKILTMRGENPL